MLISKKSVFPESLEKNSTVVIQTVVVKQIKRAEEVGRSVTRMNNCFSVNSSAVLHNSSSREVNTYVY